MKRILRSQIVFPAILAVLLHAGLLHAGELDPAQRNWCEHYARQPNVPKPADMLLNTDPEPQLATGFVALFNGVDLTGWKSRGGESVFGVKDGCIVGTCKPDSPSTYLCTEDAGFSDFIMTCEMRWEVESNSGVMFRAQVKGDGGRLVFGPQVEMEPWSQDREWSGGIYGQDCGGWFYPLWLKEHAGARRAQKENGWNRLTIEARGPVVKTWLNGVPIAHWKTCTYLKGFFGLQMHKATSGQVLWRELKVRRLPGPDGEESLPTTVREK